MSPSLSSYFEFEFNAKMFFAKLNGLRGFEASKPIVKSSSHDDENWGLKRTSSAQSTLTEAARMLATMSGYDVQRLQTHRENDQDSPDHLSSPKHLSP
ncbi:unnamed protein product [Rodentolepis nana]|uniref:ENTH domain-containing protein n=1 Tax=Rodentolepis nana TaxID=102285 RepID=A0A0R3TKH8_RODNA|nr:unnamed protein product [Rodentolepis nana]